jgi:cell division transport system ATP-binding protein
MITFKNVSKRYSNGHTALRNLNFHIEQGEMVFLTGHSGAGKSTLLKLIGLLERPSAGEIIVNQRDLNQTKNRHIAYHRREVGMIFQDHRLLNERTVFDNVAMPLVISGIRHLERCRRVRAALERVGLLDKEKMYPETLSGGEQQRVGIARAIVSRPPIILADEPTGNLDPDLSQEMMQLFLDFNAVGMTLLIATHDIDLIEPLDQPILHIEAGQRQN